MLRFAIVVFLRKIRLYRVLRPLGQKTSPAYGTEGFNSLLSHFFFLQSTFSVVAAYKNRKTSRRGFLWLCGSATIGGVATAAMLREEKAGVLSLASRQSWALGAKVSMKAMHADLAVAENAITAAFAELEKVESLMSIYRRDSQLCELNRIGVLYDPHPYLLEVLRAAGRHSQQTDGAFDITVQPLWRLYSNVNADKRSPSGNAVVAARAKVDWRRVEISEKRIQLHGAGTAITLNGIAQGYAADRASTAIKSFGVKCALIDTGEFSSVGGKSPGNPWSIGIQHPRENDSFISIAKLNNRCLATSGDYATRFTNNYRHNHLFDPHTGESPTELSSTTICAPSAMQADALSTAVFVLGLERGMELIEELADVDALLVLKNGKTFATKNFPAES